MDNILTDNIDIKDGVGAHGFVIITDKDGNVLVKKSNMVVKKGREFVFGKFYGDSNFSKLRLKSIYFGDQQAETTTDYTNIDKISDGNNIYKRDIEYITEGNSILTDSNKIRAEKLDLESGYGIKLVASGIKCDPSLTSNLSCLSVVYGDPNDSTDERLFSRIRFDIIPMVEGNELNLTYYIYF